MSTRCTIRFRYDDEEFFVYRHSDGFPDIVIPDIEAAIEKSNGRWLVCASLLVTLFLADNFDSQKDRLPEYEITSGFHGDESYLIHVDWNEAEKKWIVCPWSSSSPTIRKNDESI